MIGCGRNFRLGGLQELLVTAIDEFRNLAADEISGTGKDFDVAVVILLDGRRNVVLLQEYPAFSTGRFQQLESMITEIGYRVIKAAFFGVLVFRHFGFAPCREPAQVRARQLPALPASKVRRYTEMQQADTTFAQRTEVEQTGGSNTSGVEPVFSYLQGDRCGTSGGKIESGRAAQAGPESNRADWEHTLAS